MFMFRQFIYPIQTELIDAAQAPARDDLDVAPTLNPRVLNGSTFYLRLSGATTTPATVPASIEWTLISATPNGGHNGT